MRPFGMITTATAALLGLAFQLSLLVILVWALVVIIKLPAILERQASIQMQIQGSLREILAEIRSVTKQSDD